MKARAIYLYCSNDTRHFDCNILPPRAGASMPGIKGGRFLSGLRARRGRKCRSNWRSISWPVVKPHAALVIRVMPLYDIDNNGAEA